MASPCARKMDRMSFEDESNVSGSVFAGARDEWPELRKKEREITRESKE